MRVLYFGIYDPNYTRNRVLINGLKKNGVEVLECNIKPGKRAKVFLKLFRKYWKFKGKYDTMVVGFPGQEVVFLARVLNPFGFIVFDAFTSHYGGYILDRKKAAKNSLRARWYKFLDKYSCKLADIVLLDTNVHISFFVEELKLPRSKFRRIWAGADDSVFKPENHTTQNDKFRVLFFGHYIPLQGVEYIVRAAKVVLDKDKDVVLRIIGNGESRKEVEKLAKNVNANNIEFIDKVSILDLKREIAISDVCLGIFGDTPKTPLVIPNKVYDAVAMEKPVITADTPAIRELFDERDLYLVRAADPENLAAAIINLKNNPTLRNKLARNGYVKFKENASCRVLGKMLLEILKN